MAGSGPTESLSAAMPMVKLLVGINVLLLLVANFATSATVRIEGYGPFDSIKSEDVTSTNFFKGLHDLIAARAWLLAFAVGVMSGIWPYMKLFTTMFVADAVVNDAVDMKRGYRLLKIVEGLGKWSYSDMNLLCLNAIVFDVSTDEYQVLIFFHLQIDLFWKLGPGVFAFLCAIIMSSLLTHWVVSHLAPPSLLTDAEVKPLTSNDVEQQHSGDDQRPNKYIPQWCGAIAGLMSLALLCFGSAMPFLYVQREGFLGNLIRNGREVGLPRELELSVFSVMRILNQLAAFRQQPLFPLLGIVWFLVNFLIPLLELTMLSTSLASSVVGQGMSQKTRRLAEFFHSFGCVEVLVMSIVFTMLELPDVVNHQLAEQCSSLQNIYSGGPVLTVSGLGMAADSDCFRLVGNPKIGFWLLLSSVLLRTLAWRFIK